MPSINPRSWKGVSTSNEQLTLNYIADGLRSLERSTTVISENLSNILLQNPEGTGNVKVSEEVAEAQKTIERNDKLKKKVKSVLESNEEAKLEMKKYLQNCKTWGESFEEECQKLDAEIMSITKDMVEIKEIDSNKSLLTSNIILGLCNFIGKTGRNTITIIKRKWANGRVFEHVFEGNEASMLLPYYF